MLIHPHDDTANDGVWVAGDDSQATPIGEKVHYARPSTYVHSALGQCKILTGMTSSNGFEYAAGFAIEHNTDPAIPAGSQSRLIGFDPVSGEAWVLLDVGPVTSFDAICVGYGSSAGYGTSFSASLFTILVVLEDGTLWERQNGTARLGDRGNIAPWVAVAGPWGAVSKVIMQPSVIYSVHYVAELPGAPAVWGPDAPLGTVASVKTPCVWLISSTGALYGRGSGSFGKRDISGTLFTRQLTAPPGVLAVLDNLYLNSDGYLVRRTWNGALGMTDSLLGTTALNHYDRPPSGIYEVNLAVNTSGQLMRHIRSTVWEAGTAFFVWAAFQVGVDDHWADAESTTGVSNIPTNIGGVAVYGFARRTDGSLWYFTDIDFIGLARVGVDEVCEQYAFHYAAGISPNEIIIRKADGTLWHWVNSLSGAAAPYAHGGRSVEVHTGTTPWTWDVLTTPDMSPVLFTSLVGNGALLLAVDTSGRLWSMYDGGLKCGAEEVSVGGRCLRVLPLGPRKSEVFAEREDGVLFARGFPAGVLSSYEYDVYDPSFQRVSDSFPGTLVTVSNGAVITTEGVYQSSVYSTLLDGPMTTYAFDLVDDTREYLAVSGSQIVAATVRAEVGTALRVWGPSASLQRMLVDADWWPEREVPVPDGVGDAIPYTLDGSGSIPIAAVYLFSHAGTFCLHLDSYAVAGMHDGVFGYPPFGDSSAYPNTLSYDDYDAGVRPLVVSKIADTPPCIGSDFSLLPMFSSAQEAGGRRRVTASPGWASSTYPTTATMTGVIVAEGFSEVLDLDGEIQSLVFAPSRGYAVVAQGGLTSVASWGAVAPGVSALKRLASATGDNAAMMVNLVGALHPDPHALHPPLPVRRDVGRQFGMDAGYYPPPKMFDGAMYSLGQFSSAYMAYPTPIPHSEIVDYSGVRFRSMLIGRDGRVWQCVKDYITGSYVAYEKWNAWPYRGHFVRVFASPAGNFAIRNDGTLWSSTGYAQVGVDASWQEVNCTALNAGSNGTVSYAPSWAGIRDGRLYAWGTTLTSGLPVYNSASKVLTQSAFPAELIGLSAIGYNRITYALDSAGSVWRWGKHSGGALSDGVTPAPTITVGAAEKVLEAGAGAVMGGDVILAADGRRWVVQNRMAYASTQTVVQVQYITPKNAPLLVGDLYDTYATTPVSMMPYVFIAEDTTLQVSDGVAAPVALSTEAGFVEVCVVMSGVNKVLSRRISSAYPPETCGAYLKVLAVKADGSVWQTPAFLTSDIDVAQSGANYQPTMVPIDPASLADIGLTVVPGLSGVAKISSVSRTVYGQVDLFFLKADGTLWRSYLASSASTDGLSGATITTTNLGVNASGEAIIATGLDLTTQAPLALNQAPKVPQQTGAAANYTDLTGVYVTDASGAVFRIRDSVELFGTTNDILLPAEVAVYSAGTTFMSPPLGTKLTAGVSTVRGSGNGYGVALAVIAGRLWYVGDIGAEMSWMGAPYVATTLLPTEIGVGIVWKKLCGAGAVLAENGDLYRISIGGLTQVPGKWLAACSTHGVRADGTLWVFNGYTQNYYGSWIASGLTQVGTSRNWVDVPADGVFVRDSVKATALNWTAP